MELVRVGTLVNSSHNLVEFSETNAHNSSQELKPMFAPAEPAYSCANARSSVSVAVTMRHLSSTSACAASVAFSSIRRRFVRKARASACSWSFATVACSFGGFGVYWHEVDGPGLML